MNKADQIVMREQLTECDHTSFPQEVGVAALVGPVDSDL